MDHVRIQSGVTAAIPPKQKPSVAGVIPAPDSFREVAKGTRFVLTSAQNNTKVHKGFWKALQKFAKYNKAQIMVSRFSYNKNAWQKSSGITKDSDAIDGEKLWYAEEVLPHVQNYQIKIADGIVFCAELDILPTAKDPLSGLDNYTGTNSMVVPHAKVHMRSYAGLLSGQDQRFGYTTGTCTLRNYIDRRAGQIASYHHVYGALYVEVAEDGNWFARQLIAGDDGSFFDIDTLYTPKVVFSKQHEKFPSFYPEGKWVINLGDIHAEKSEPIVFAGAMQFVETIEPDFVVIHDLEDFEARNHHNLKDPFFLADQFYNGLNTVEANFKHSAIVLSEIQRHATEARMLIVRSNHDQAFDRWLKEYDIRKDPANADFYHYHMWQRHKAIRMGGSLDNFALALGDAAAGSGLDTSNWIHVREDDSYVINEIEYGLHGHLGPNGSRGSPKGYRQLGRKLNTGHTHSAGIIDGVWTAGLLASLRMGYNKGPSSWSHSHILTLPNGKRQMITQNPVTGRWRA